MLTLPSLLADYIGWKRNSIILYAFYIRAMPFNPDFQHYPLFVVPWTFWVVFISDCCVLHGRHLFGFVIIVVHKQAWLNIGRDQNGSGGSKSARYNSSRESESEAYMSYLTNILKDRTAFWTWGFRSEAENKLKINDFTLMFLYKYEKILTYPYLTKLVHILTILFRVLSSLELSVVIWFTPSTTTR